MDEYLRAEKEELINLIGIVINLSARLDRLESWALNSDDAVKKMMASTDRMIELYKELIAVEVHEQLEKLTQKDINLR